jgi:uncharacterized membrane-anchored protein YjiN (DUF445 family)
MDLIVDSLLNAWVDESWSCMETWLKDDVNAGNAVVEKRIEFIEKNQ